MALNFVKDVKTLKGEIDADQQLILKYDPQNGKALSKGARTLTDEILSSGKLSIEEKVYYLESVAYDVRIVRAGLRDPEGVASSIGGKFFEESAAKLTLGLKDYIEVDNKIRPRAETMAGALGSGINPNELGAGRVGTVARQPTIGQKPTEEAQPVGQAGQPKKTSDTVNCVSCGPAHSAAQFSKYKEYLGAYETANPVIDSLRTSGKLPSNYVDKATAEAAGWRAGKALNNSVPGGQIGGDVFQNTTGILPSQTGRTWYEADIGLNGSISRAKQPGTRLLYSDDGLIYITTDHYKSVYKIGRWK